MLERLRCGEGGEYAVIADPQAFPDQPATCVNCGRLNATLGQVRKTMRLDGQKPKLGPSGNVHDKAEAVKGPAK
jgi:hypothetical protein